MKISFIGSGNVATHLALAFNAAGATIHQVWSRNLEHAALLAHRVGATPYSLDDIDSIRVTSDVIILAVSDDALYELAPRLHFGNTLVLHTAGAAPMSVLQGVSTHYGVLWSPQSFVRDMAMDYSALPFCIEGSDVETEVLIRHLVQQISEHIYHADSAQRDCLHLSAVFVNNFVNGLYGIAQQLCRDNQVPFDVLCPLIINTAQRAQWGDVRGHLTGPAVRRDDKTIEKHLQILYDNPLYQDIYRQMTALLQSLK